VNGAQKLWWRQSQSDCALFANLQAIGASECHLLHYLQMATEKLSKAYFWRSGHPPSRSHVGFVRFLRALLNRPTSEMDWISQVLGFGRTDDLEKWVINIQPLAYDLQNIAPSEAGNGPNPEYPWPHEWPVEAPADHQFLLWKHLANTGRGRKLMGIIERAIQRFEEYA